MAQDDEKSKVVQKRVPYAQVTNNMVAYSRYYIPILMTLYALFSPYTGPTRLSCLLE